MLYLGRAQPGELQVSLVFLAMPLSKSVGIIVFLVDILNVIDGGYGWIRVHLEALTPAVRETAREETVRKQ
jgi:hypothetical protein